MGASAKTVPPAGQAGVAGFRGGRPVQLQAPVVRVEDQIPAPPVGGVGSQAPAGRPGAVGVKGPRAEDLFEAAAGVTILLSVILFVRTRGRYTKWLAIIIFITSFAVIYTINPESFKCLRKTIGTGFNALVLNIQTKLIGKHPVNGRGKRRLDRQAEQGQPDQFFSLIHAAACNAKYVRMPSAPARLIPVSASMTTAFSSSQPLIAAAFNIAYSPDTW